jgi:adenine-specific DNA-methyltransferase
MSSSELSTGRQIAGKLKAESSGEAAARLALRRPARAELIWEGKYDAHGRRVAPLRVALPFQTVETVNESAQERQRGFLFGPGFREEEWRNRLIWGDKKYVLPSLLAEFAGKVNLIYIDPPFDTGADFSFTARVPGNPETENDSFTFTKEPSIIEQKAYRDTWGRGLDSYLQWFYEAIVLLHELLRETGSIYVHLDEHVGHYAKVILDEIFGGESYVNTIIWKRSDAHSDIGQGAKHLGKVCDYILYYVKTPEAQTVNMQFAPLPTSTIEKWYRHIEEGTGRRYNKADITGPGGARKGNPVYEWNGITRAWRFSKQRMQELEEQGRIVYSNSGQPYFKRYLDESKGVPLQDLWDDIKMIRGIHTGSETLGYATQKPEALLERIIKLSSNEGDLVLDCFAGSGTTAAVAEKLSRRWIACDLSRFAIHTTRKRLLLNVNVRPFIVQNLGKYERQLWAGAQFGDDQTAARQRSYTEFILKLAGATPLHGYTWLHGVRGGRMVHVGAVDAPVSVGDVTQIAAEFKRAIGTGKDAPKTNGVDVLGWDFAFELNEIARQQAAAANIQMRFLRIPRDVMDKRAVEQGDIRFFELAALSVDVKTNKRNVALKLKDFVIPPDDVPDEARRAVKHWSQWIDYWAVDWDNKSDTFHNEWQTYRTRKDNTLALEINHSYADAGEYTVVVKVIDILGNDTTKTMKVKLE